MAAVWVAQTMHISNHSRACAHVCLDNLFSLGASILCMLAVLVQFFHLFLLEVSAVVRAHVAAMGGNAMVSHTSARFLETALTYTFAGAHVAGSVAALSECASL
jgi:hypothetical protein